MAGRKEIIKETWKSLGKKYRVMGKNLPLMIGVTEDLVRRHPEIEMSIMASVLRTHFGSPYYRRAVSEGGPRYDLDGNPCGEVSEDARTDAAEKYAKWVAKRKAARAHQTLEKERLLVKKERLAQVKLAATLYEETRANEGGKRQGKDGSGLSTIVSASKDGTKKFPKK